MTLNRNVCQPRQGPQPAGQSSTQTAPGEWLTLGNAPKQASFYDCLLLLNIPVGLSSLINLHITNDSFSKAYHDCIG